MFGEKIYSNYRKNILDLGMYVPLFIQDKRLGQSESRRMGEISLREGEEK